ncbi:hypothetical protein P3102_15765 [Amycolatopsis sp. QT-25]|uniref:hypothetical protein n=1 Tax=Amycolatopsis sp. QT-25 TaxID=3034022 RepID=UPI0023ECFC46|nr:hypothetical protein [Amycolatopsis sp. QT-25]WET82554.1 hypothetical protein P3102_15765 [Amycolatopsis sp. QT-25]
MIARDGAAVALVNGWGLRFPGHAIGLADRRLSKTVGSLGDQVQKLTWVRDHLEEGSGA